MSLATLEKEILEKARRISGKNLKKSNLMEWQCGKGIEPEDDEDIYFIESLNIEVVFKK